MHCNNKFENNIQNTQIFNVTTSSFHKKYLHQGHIHVPWKYREMWWTNESRGRIGTQSRDIFLPRHMQDSTWSVSLRVTVRMFRRVYLYESRSVYPWSDGVIGRSDSFHKPSCRFWHLCSSVFSSVRSLVLSFTYQSKVTDVYNRFYCVRLQTLTELREIWSQHSRWHHSEEVPVF